MKRFEAVIFDMDGVIFDSELLVIKCWQVVADKYGIKNIEDTCHKCLGLNKDATKKLMLGVYGADFPYDEYKAEMSALFHEQAAGGKLPMKPGVTGLLQTLKRMEGRSHLHLLPGKQLLNRSFGMQVSFRISIG